MDDIFHEVRDERDANFLYDVPWRKENLRSGAEKRNETVFYFWKHNIVLTLPTKPIPRYDLRRTTPKKILLHLSISASWNRARDGFIGTLEFNSVVSECVTPDRSQEVSFWECVHVLCMYVWIFPLPPLWNNQKMHLVPISTSPKNRERVEDASTSCRQWKSEQK